MKDNGLLVQYFNANTPADQTLWAKAAKDAATLKKLGATAVWFPPATKGAAGKDDRGYAPYDLYDLGEFNQKGSVGTRYGTKKEYLEAIDAMKAQGINVYADIAVRQKLGADSVEKVTAADFNAKDIPQMIGNKKIVGALSKFNFPGRKSKYSKFKWNWNHFAGIDWQQDDFKRRVCELSGMTETEAEKIPGWFIRDFAEAASNAGEEEKEIFTVGDFWHWRCDYINDYIASADNQPSMFDVPLHFSFHDASVAEGEYDLSRLLDGSMMMSNPAKAVTFVENHESQPGGVLESAVAEWFKPLAYAIILLREQGYPCMFMGDYEGIPAAKIKSRKTIMNKLLKLRKKYAYGTQHDYFDHPDVVGFTREGDAEHENSGLAVIMSDGTGGTKRMYVGRQFAGCHFADVMGNAKYDIRIDEEGCGEFYVNRQGIAIWIKKDCKL